MHAKISPRRGLRQRGAHPRLTPRCPAPGNAGCWCSWGGGGLHQGSVRAAWGLHPLLIAWVLFPLPTSVLAAIPSQQKDALSACTCSSCWRAGAPPRPPFTSIPSRCRWSIPTPPGGGVPCKPPSISPSPGSLAQERGCWGRGEDCSEDPLQLPLRLARGHSCPPSAAACERRCSASAEGRGREGGGREGTSLSGSISSAASHMLREGDAVPRVPLSEAALLPAGAALRRAGGAALRLAFPPPPPPPLLPLGFFFFFLTI